MNGRRLALALTMGDPAGIGPDLALAIWQNRSVLGVPPFLMIADPEMLAERADLLGLKVALTASSNCFPQHIAVNLWVAVGRAVRNRCARAT